MIDRKQVLIGLVSAIAGAAAVLVPSLLDGGFNLHAEHLKHQWDVEHRQKNDEDQRNAKKYDKAALHTELKVRIGPFLASVLLLKQEIEGRLAKGDKAEPELAQRLSELMEELDHPSHPFFEEFKDKKLLDLLKSYEPLDAGVKAGDLLDEGEGIARVFHNIQVRQELSVLKEHVDYLVSVIKYGKISALTKPIPKWEYHDLS
jgi:hypothetical protein